MIAPIRTEKSTPAAVYVFVWQEENPFKYIDGGVGTYWKYKKNYGYTCVYIITHTYSEVEW